MLAEKALGPGRGAGVRVVLTTASGHLMAFLQKACDLHRRTRKRVPTNSQATVHWKCLYCKLVGTQTLPTLLLKAGKSELSLTMNNECSLSYTRRLARPDLFFTIQWFVYIDSKEEVQGLGDPISIEMLSIEVRVVIK